MFWRPSQVAVKASDYCSVLYRTLCPVKSCLNALLLAFRGDLRRRYGIAPLLPRDAGDGVIGVAALAAGTDPLEARDSSGYRSCPL
jgi:hypothetical protein